MNKLLFLFFITVFVRFAHAEGQDNQAEVKPKFTAVKNSASFNVHGLRAYKGESDSEDALGTFEETEIAENSGCSSK